MSPRELSRFERLGRFRRPLIALLLFLAFELFLVVFLDRATGYNRPRMWDIWFRVSIGFFSAILAVFLTPKWLMRRLIRILFNLVAACLVYLAATGTILLFSDGLDLQVALLSKHHTLSGFAFGLPMGIYLGIHVWREVMSSRGGERWVGGAAALALLVGIVTGSSLLLGPGAEGVSRYGMVHVASSYLALALIAWHLVRAARGARRRGATARPRARRYPGALEIALWVVLCAIGLGRMQNESDEEMARLSRSDGPGSRGDAPIEPAFARTADAIAVPAIRLAPAMEGCGRDRGCHMEIQNRWEKSAHARSSTNPFYRAVVEDLVKENTAADARTCAACHDPVLLLSGQLHDGASYPAATEFTSDGVTCQVCHALVSGDANHGNGDYVVQLPPPILYEGIFEGVEEKVNYNVTKLRPGFHADAYSQPFLDSPEACGVCHGLSKERAHGTVIFQDTYSSWQQGRSDGRVEKNCLECHMPMVPATDTAGTDGRVHDHATLGSNGVLAWLEKGEAMDRTRFRKSGGKFQVALSVVNGRVDAAVSAPGVGHTWPGGVSDLTQTWLEIEGWNESGEQVAFTGGILDDGRLSPAALRFGIGLVGEDGERLERHEVWKTDRIVPLRRILPGEVEVVRWDPGTPKVARFRARLLSRRYGVDFMRHAGVSLRQGPVVELARTETKVEPGAR